MYRPGDRVRMLVCGADPTGIKNGAEGTVRGSFEPLDLLYVDWDDGCRLNVCLDVDVIERVEE